jgi:sulfur-carrier protein
MPLTFHIPGPLRQFTAGLPRVQLDVAPATLREALELLWVAYPGLRDRVLTEEGQVREHINIFVGNESVRFAEGLATPIPVSAEISIIPAISGGSDL